MSKEIEAFINKSEGMKEFLKILTIKELKIIRILIKTQLLENVKKDNNLVGYTMPNVCYKGFNNFLDEMISFRNRVERNAIKLNIEETKDKKLCDDCVAKNCIKKDIAILKDEINKYNTEYASNINELDVLDYILKIKKTEFKSIPEDDFFNNVDIIDLIHIRTLLEAELIILENTNENIITAKYLDLTEKNKDSIYVNILLDFFANIKSNENIKKIKIDLKNIDSIFTEKDKFLRMYKIATYYLYLMEVEHINIIEKLKELIEPENSINGMQVRTHFFIYKYFNKVNDLPYSKKTKEKIYDILNYILNYNYNSAILIPINIVIYSNDKEGIEKISKIIGEFMWFFHYLEENMKYYNEYMNNVILDKFNIKRIYYEYNKENAKPKSGILLLHNFESLLYTENIKQNLILNIFTDEMEANNKNVCTIIYGNKKILKQLLGNSPRLSKMLINLELEIDDLSIEKIYELIIQKLENTVNVPTKVKEKIYNYIRTTYNQSDLQNMEYINRLYNLIILNMNKNFKMKVRPKLKISDIPEAYNTKDLPEIMKEFNSLVGLKEIKEQINDLICLLKYNKKANINIENFNLHMCFIGNPGTGKTTVARLLTDIFFYLGYIKQNKLTEVTAKDLIAEYIGQTSGKTYNVVKSALGGILFIDEAYSITSGNDSASTYGNECVATLLKLMEDYKDKLIIIFAGYEEEMETFLNSNSGLTSRIGYKIKFPIYTIEELSEIFINLLHSNKLEITKTALDKVIEILKISSKSKNFGNGRYIHQMFQKILIEHAKNVENSISNKNLYLITEEDIKQEKLIVDRNNKKIGF